MRVKPGLPSKNLLTKAIMLVHLLSRIKSAQVDNISAPWAVLMLLLSLQSHHIASHRVSTIHHAIFLLSHWVAGRHTPIFCQVPFSVHQGFVHGVYDVACIQER
jgi:hypothetical protein